MKYTEKTKEVIKLYNEKKKKTFEIDVKLEKYIRVQAAKENITINEWVNKTLWAAIPDDTKEFIKS